MTAVMDPGARVPVGDRIPIRDVRPQVRGGAVPVKAVTGESLTIGATVFREGPGAIGVNVVLRDPDGRPGAWTPMTLTDPDSDRWEATVVAAGPAAGRTASRHGPTRSPPGATTPN